MGDEPKFLGGEEALRRLNMRKEQLDALVNEGELRMYRQGGDVMFKEDDIEDLNEQLEQLREDYIELGEWAEEELKRQNEQYNKMVQYYNATIFRLKVYILVMAFVLFLLILAVIYLFFRGRFSFRGRRF